LIIAIFVSSISSSLAGQTKRLPVPNESAQREAKRVIAEIYKAEYEKAKTSEQKAKLAQKLIDAALETVDDPAGQYSLLKIAIDVALNAANIEIAFASIHELNQRYQIDALATKVNAVTKASKIARRRDDLKELSKKISLLLGEIVAEDRYDLGDQLGKVAVTTARKTEDSNLLEQVLGQVDDIEQQKSSFAKIKVALATLELSPTDAEANLLLGKYRCFRKGDWKTGLPMLAIGQNPELKQVAGLELKESKSVEDQVALGNSWFELSVQMEGVEKKYLEERSVHWYKQALPHLKGLAKAKVSTRLELVGEPLENKTAVKPSNTASKRLRVFKLGGRNRFPRIFAPIAQVRVGKSGIVLVDRHYLRSRVGNYLNEDFTFELLLSMAEKKKFGDIIAFIGLGEARRDRAYNEPKRSIFLQWHAPDVGNGETALVTNNEKAPLGEKSINEKSPIGHVREPGTHLVRIAKRGDSVTFTIDVGNDGKDPADLETTIPNIREQAPFLHNKNTFLFFGGGALYHEVRFGTE
jgi:hypothetical protein